MRTLCAAVVLCLIIFPAIGMAQDGGGRDIWIQIEARPTLAKVQSRLRAYSKKLPDVGGFRMKSGWYAVALGPYSRTDAQRLLRTYLGERRIPADALLARQDKYVEQIWPVGGSDNVNVSEPPELARALPADAPPRDIDKTTPPPPDEGETEARQSEALLNDAQRAELQRALTWAGVYDGPIDAEFGPGTREAMARWQKKNGYFSTGVLTTGQRANLIKAYDIILDEIGLTPIRDDATGISIDLPAGLIRFDRHDSPFSVYEPTTDFAARVILVSRPGDFKTLKGLYTLMQSEDFSAGEGPRTISPDEFKISGANDDQVSITEAWLRDGQVRGFTLIWPAGDEQRRERLLEKMRESFSVFEDAPVEPEAEAEPESETEEVEKTYALGVDDTSQQIARLSRSGFYVSEDGIVMTTAEVAQNCERVTINGHPARVLTPDASKHLVLLQQETPVIPPAYASWNEALAVGNDVISAGFSYGGVLGAPSLNFGTVTELNDPDKLVRLVLATGPSDSGGPVFAADGGVAGMLWMKPVSESESVTLLSFAVPAAEVREILSHAGLPEGSQAKGPDLPVPALARKARDMTVLVECW